MIIRDESFSLHLTSRLISYTNVQNDDKVLFTRVYAIGVFKSKTMFLKPIIRRSRGLFFRKRSL